MKNKNQYIITIKDILKIFLKRKWALIATVLIVLIAGYLYIFLKTPLYESNSKLQINNVYYNEDILKYFPEEAEILEVYSNNTYNEEIIRNILNNYLIQFKEQSFLDEVALETGYNLKKENILESLILFAEYDKKTLLVKVMHEDPEISFKINYNLISTFMDKKNSGTLSAINSLVSKIETEQKRLEDEIDKTSDQEIEEAAISIFNDMESIKYNLVNNKEFIINRLEVSQKPEVHTKATNVNLLKEILVTLFLSLLAGIIVIFLPNVFLSLKIEDERK